MRQVGQLGSTVNELAVGAKSQGYAGTFGSDDALRAAVGEEVQYLIDKKHVELVPMEISPEVKSYRINANGRDWLATQGL